MRVRVPPSAFFIEFSKLNFKKNFPLDLDRPPPPMLFYFMLRNINLILATIGLLNLSAAMHSVSKLAGQRCRHAMHPMDAFRNTPLIPQGEYAYAV